MKYQVSHETNAVRLIRGGTSILLGQLSYTERFRDDELAPLVTLVNKLKDDLGGIKREKPNAANPLKPDSFSPASTAPLYKFVSAQTLERLKSGSFQFGSARYYREHENPKISDDREGFSHFHLQSGNYQLNVSVTSGFNCYLFCGTTQPYAQQSAMQSSFGDRLIVINDVQGFARRACSLLGATRFHEFDVVYTDLKHYVKEIRGIDRLKNACGPKFGNMDFDKLNRSFFQIFYDVSFMPSLFAKPLKFQIENERRIVFERNRDLTGPTKKKSDAKLAEFIEEVPY